MNSLQKSISKMKYIMLDFRAFRVSQKTNEIEKEVELTIDSFLKDCAKTKEKSFIVFYDNRAKDINFYYKNDYGNSSKELTFPKDLKSYIYPINMLMVFKSLEEKYRRYGYKVKYNIFFGILSFDLNE